MNYSMPAPTAVPMPTDAERRVRLLKENQKEIARALAQYHKERHLLKRKQHLEFVQSHFDRIGKVIRGEHKPTEREGRWHLDDERDDDEVVKKGKDRKSTKKQAGIPGYWLTVLQNGSDLVQDHDEPILKHLDDVKCTPSDDGFVLEFAFAPNDYFSNSVLTKTYALRFAPDEENPHDFVGPKIFKSTGCQIDWKKPELKETDDDDDEEQAKRDKSNKKSKAKDKKGSKKKKEKATPAPFMERYNKSFFRFFQTPSVADNVKLDDLDPFDRRDLERDFGTGESFIHDLIANSVHYFTGDALESDDEESDESSEDDDEDDEDDDEEDGETEKKQDDATKKRGFFSKLFSK